MNKETIAMILAFIVGGYIFLEVNAILGIGIVIVIMIFGRYWNMSGELKDDVKDVKSPKSSDDGHTTKSGNKKTLEDL